MNALETLVNGPLQEMAKKQQTVKMTRSEVISQIESVYTSITILTAYLGDPWKGKMQACAASLKELTDVLKHAEITFKETK
jgi:hypothetical protein